MNIDDFRYITTIAEMGSFSKAAKELFIAQPSLSQRVKYIENSYGISIFARGTKGVDLTEDGKIFLRYAQSILNNEDDLRKELADRHNRKASSLRIGATQVMDTFLFSELIKLFSGRHPDLQFEFIQNKSTELEEMLLSGKIDVAIVYLPLISKELNTHAIFQDRYVLVPATGSPLEKKILEYSPEGFDAVPLSFLARQTFALTPENTRLFNDVTQILDNQGFQINIQHYGKNYSILYNMAQMGISSTILLESYFDPEKEYIPYYYLDAEDTELEIGIAWRKGAYLSEAARDLIHIAAEIQHT